jgi:hypothetical protein
LVQPGPAKSGEPNETRQFGGSFVRLQRVETTEAMCVVLAWTHPNWSTVLELLRFWMGLGIDPNAPEYLQGLASAEPDRVMEHWQRLLSAAPTASTAGDTLQ